MTIETFNKKYLVLLVDLAKARLFTVNSGRIDETKEIFDPSVPQKVKRINEAWGREDKIIRHIQNHINRHLKLIAAEVAKFANGKNIHFILIGGHKQLFAKVKKHLPGNLADKVRGTFVTELNIPLSDIFLKSKKYVQKLFDKNQ